MPDDAYPHLEEALPGFHRARALIKAAGDSITPLGMKGSKFDFHRFVNRLRLMRQFRGLVLEGFETPTTDGYGALTRVFMAWSVFERYAELTGEHPPFHRILGSLSRQELSELANLIDHHDRERKLFDFLHEQSLEVNQRDLDRYREGDDRRAVLAMAAAIRHIYVHGHLTAHPNGCASEDLQVICHALSDFLIQVISTDFDRRVRLAEVLEANRKRNAGGDRGEIR